MVSVKDKTDTIFAELNKNREDFFYSIRDTIPPQKVEVLEKVWRILKAHNRRLSRVSKSG